MEGTSGGYIDPAGAGGLLLAVLCIGIGIGLFIGWLAGAAGIGAIVGAVIGILAGIYAVYRRYRGAF